MAGFHNRLDAKSMLPVTAEQFKIQVPTGFEFELDRGISDPEIGNAILVVRMDDKVFSERYPSGRMNRLRILGRAKVGDIDGTIVEKVGSRANSGLHPGSREPRRWKSNTVMWTGPDQWTLVGHHAESPVSQPTAINDGRSMEPSMNARVDPHMALSDVAPAIFLFFSA